MSSNFWFVDQEGNQSGPVERDEIIRRIKNGTITRKSMLWTEGMDAWCEAHKIEGLAAAFAPPPLAVAAAAALAAPASISPCFEPWQHDRRHRPQRAAIPIRADRALCRAHRPSDPWRSLLFREQSEERSRNRRSQNKCLPTGKDRFSDSGDGVRKQRARPSSRHDNECRR